MNRSLPLLAVGGVCLLLGLPTAARAEIMVGESIEWVVADSDWVGVGHLLKAERADGGRFEAATLRVTRTFRGAAAEQMTFLVPSYHGAVASAWLADGQPMLFCLIRSDNPRLKNDGLPAGHGWVLRDHRRQLCAVPLGVHQRQWAQTIAVYSRDFKVLTRPEEVVKRVEQAAAAAPHDRPAKRYIANVPGGTEVFEKLWGGSSVLLIVPADAVLEQAGRDWCHSPDFSTRFEGAKALGHFKNERNIELLQALLQDPGYTTVNQLQPPNGKGKPQMISRFKSYEVRRVAFETLRAFGVPVERPILEEPVMAADR
jgi:hypothetical protein